MKRCLFLGIALILVLALSLGVYGCSGDAATSSPTTTQPTTTSPTTTTPPTTPPAEDITVYVSVSVEGELLVAAQPVAATTGMTLDDVLKAAHAAFYSGGESGYTAGIDPTWGMYLISQCWGILNTPYIIYNDSPLGADPSLPTTVNAVNVAANDNIIICTGADTSIISPVSLVALRSGDSVILMAVAWTLDFATFSYSHTLLAGANVIDPTTGASLGVTDDNGELVITPPESGVVAIEGMAAINAIASAVDE